MELTQLRYFLEVAEQQHMTKSAEKLHIAQPSLTKSIHNLEAELGVPLFLPKGRNIVLSEYGRYLKKRLTPILRELEELPDTMRSLANLKNETIHINVLAASTFLTEVIVAYKKENPDIKFEFLQNYPEEICDIYVTTKLFYQVDEEQKGQTFVCNEKIFLAVPDLPKFHGRSGISLTDVMQENFISLSEERQFRVVCDKLCQHMAFKPNIVFESDSPTAVKNMIASGMGVGFWPEFTWGDMTGGQILLLPIKDTAFSRDIIVTYKLNKTDNRYVVDFFNFLQDYCEKAKGKFDAEAVHDKDSSAGH
ncbi:MAG: LysR family transcriptional regulator [Oscillospiraceae bacterium]